ncbi:MAG TPA: antitoxin Xre/MbcA/ParS toxin-binding domain-containing protein [Oculatellaceae cyanobacterium]
MANLAHQYNNSLMALLGGKASKEAGLSGFDLIELSNKGVTRKAVESLAQFIGVSQKFFAEEILQISVKTIERKSATDKLDKKLSSHIIEVARVVQHAREVFEDPEKVKTWFNKANRALNNAKPAEMLDTLTGLQMVNDILGRIEEGVYS